jgi:large conductance mechanosensitive channel
LIKGFKDFILRGNVVDLAVAVVMAMAFTAVVTALLDGIVYPLVAAIFGEPELSSVGSFTVNDAVFSFGLVLQAVFNFVAVATAVYFFIVVPVTTLMEMRRRGETEEPVAVPQDVLLLQEIRDLLAAGKSGAPGGGEAWT